MDEVSGTMVRSGEGRVFALNLRNKSEQPLWVTVKVTTPETAALTHRPPIPLILACIRKPRPQLRAGMALTRGAPVPTLMELAPRE